MKRKLLFSTLCIGLLFGCMATKSDAIATPKKEVAKNDTIRIANDSLEYEVIIVDSGFSTWLASRAKPRNYYGLSYLETRNYWLVSEWNRRVLDPQRYSSDLYEMRIDYQSNIKYGYEVNYLIYNYFLYFQQKYRQKL